MNLQFVGMMKLQFVEFEAFYQIVRKERKTMFRLVKVLRQFGPFFYYYLYGILNVLAGTVAELTGTNKTNANVRISTIAGFAQRGIVEEVDAPLISDYEVALCVLRNYATGGYDPLKRNCVTFARGCSTGIWESYQANSVMAFAILAGIVLLGILRVKCK